MVRWYTSIEFVVLRWLKAVRVTFPSVTGQFSVFRCALKPNNRMTPLTTNAPPNAIAEMIG